MSKKPIPFKDLKKLGERLKLIRENSGFKTQKAIAQVLGVTHVSVGNWENGKDEPPLGYLAYWADKFQSSLNWLIMGQEVAISEREATVAQREAEVAKREADVAKREAAIIEELKKHDLNISAVQDVLGVELEKE